MPVCLDRQYACLCVLIGRRLPVCLDRQYACLCVLIGKRLPVCIDRPWAQKIGPHAPACRIGPHAPACRIGPHAPACRIGPHAPACRIGPHAPACRIGSHAPACRIGPHAPAPSSCLEQKDSDLGRLSKSPIFDATESLQSRDETCTAGPTHSSCPPAAIQQPSLRPYPWQVLGLKKQDDVHGAHLMHTPPPPASAWPQ
eukprot:363457-Chlamydomonas_euryale.AAC.2